MTRKQLQLVCIAVLAASVAPIHGFAQDTAPDPQGPLDTRANTGLVIGAKVGGGLGLGPLGASPVGEIEIGYLLPLPEPIGRSLELFMSAQYMQPGTDGHTTAPDPRLPGDGTMTYNVKQQVLPLTFGLLYRIPMSGDAFMPYAAAGVRVMMLKTTVSGSAGDQSFGSNDETSTSAGGYFAVGADIFLGPGALVAELQLGYAPIDGFVLRETNTSNVALALGYRFIL